MVYCIRPVLKFFVVVVAVKCNFPRVVRVVVISELMEWNHRREGLLEPSPPAPLFYRGERNVCAQRCSASYERLGMEV